MIKLPSPLLDVGTGAGFPGIPLKIAVPSLKLILAEPRPRRVQFLKEARSKLKLANVDVFDHKVTSKSMKTRVNGIITRALEPIDKTLLRTSAALVKGGQAIFMKGPNADEELYEVARRLKGSYALKLDKAYKIPHTPHERRLIVFEKLVEPQIGTGEESVDNDSVSDD